MTRFALLVLLGLALSAGTAAARGGEDQDVRVRGDCTRGATSSLRARADDKGIEVRFRLRETRGRGVWRITVAHENRVSARVKRTTTRNDDSLEVRRILPDFPGSDTIAVRAWGPRGLGCRATATFAS